jgi:hypothetical protein
MSKDKRRYEDRKEYLLKKVTERRKRLKQMAVAHKGGRCEVCGYNRCISALEFHHPDPAQKDFGMSSGGWTRAWSKIKEEIDKCMLVCANCHREIHAEWSLNE